MRILVINPNSTAEMTERIGSEARLAARPSTEVVAVNPAGSPPAIQGRTDGEAALPHLYACFDETTKDGDFDAVIIACFDDTGLWTLKQKSRCPVVGIGEAAYFAAMLLAQRFSVVTTLPVSIPVLEDNLRDYGFWSRVAKVRAANIPVLDLEASKAGPRDQIAAEIEVALAEDQCDAVVLGCAGMADIAEDLQASFSVSIIDGVKAAVGLCEMLVASASNKP